MGCHDNDLSSNLLLFRLHRPRLTKYSCLRMSLRSSCYSGSQENSATECQKDVLVETSPPEIFEH